MNEQDVLFFDFIIIQQYYWQLSYNVIESELNNSDRSWRVLTVEYGTMLPKHDDTYYNLHSLSERKGNRANSQYINL